MIKPKIKCNNCGNNNIIKKGLRKNKLKKIQKYLCKNCNKIFTLKELKNKSYSARVILNAISYYNLGYSLDNSSKIINKRYKVNVSGATIHNWLREFKDICGFMKIRDGALKYNSSFFQLSIYFFWYLNLHFISHYN